MEKIQFILPFFPPVIVYEKVHPDKVWKVFSCQAINVHNMYFVMFNVSSASLLCVYDYLVYMYINFQRLIFYVKNYKVLVI